MRDRVERLKSLQLADLESRRGQLLDELSAVHVAMTERAVEDAARETGPVSQRIGRSMGRALLQAYERQPLRFGLVVLFLAVAIGSQLLEVLGVG